MSIGPVASDLRKSRMLVPIWRLGSRLSERFLLQPNHAFPGIFGVSMEQWEANNWRNSISRYDGFVESQPRLRAIPVNELANRMIVGTLRTGRGQAVEHGGFRLFKIWELQDRFGSPLLLRFCVSRHCNGLLQGVATASTKPTSLLTICPFHGTYSRFYVECKTG
jgi:hypothetical protein